jgi:N-acetylmuramoyl-L-alanine amidase
LRRLTWLAGLAAAWLAIGTLPAHAIPPGYPLEPGEAPLPPSLQVGDHGKWVADLQRELARAGFRPGPSDGRFGRATLSAVYAFEKLHGLTRDGAFDRTDWQRLEPVTLPEDLAPTRMEIDLARQILFLVRDQQAAAVLPVSSGNGEIYRSQSGHTVRAFTPEGQFAFYRHVDGWRTSYLGQLYEPFYFRGGYAIHGSTSVPPWPASHGCVRVSLSDMDWLRGELELGMPVYVYGNRLDRPATPLPPPGQPSAPLHPWLVPA